MEQDIIESEHFVDYYPPTTTDLNKYGNKICIPLFNEDIKTCPSRSSLIINGKIELKKSNETTPLSTIDTKKVNFVNNGILHFFDKISYNIAHNEIDSVQSPGYAAALKGLISFEDDIEYNLASWKVKSNNYNILSDKGYFSAEIPLSIVMGFFEDHKDYVYHIHQELVLIKAIANYNNVLMVDETVARTHSISITLSEIIWRMPQYKFSLSYETAINKEIASSIEYEMFFRHWMYEEKSSITGKTFTWDIPTSYYKPRYVIIGFQKNRNDGVTTDNGLYDLMNVENIQVSLNGHVHYPNNRLNVILSENKCSQIYRMFMNFKNSYYGKEGKPLISYNEFLSKYPIIVIDCSKQSEVIKGSTVNIKINFQWWDSFLSDSVIQCLVITSDKARYNPLKNTVVVH